VGKMMKMRSRKEEMNNNLALYLREINNIPLLSREEEELTARAAMAGNKAAREKLVNANLRFVVNVAKKYQGLGFPLEDLIGEGNIGLLTAVDRFDVNKGYHFISYAVWWIRQAIMSAIYEKARMIRLPSNRATELIKIKQAKKMIKKHFSSEAELKEVAEFLNMEKDHVESLINISREMISLDIPVSKDRSSLLMDFIEDNQYKTPDIIAEHKLMETDINNVLSTLEKNEEDVIRRHYGLGCKPMSLKEIGRYYKLSKERIRQIEERALSRLRNPARTRKLQEYVV
jgi:RNA polymerase primary sigma factor